MNSIPFNRVKLSEQSLANIQSVANSGALSGNQEWTKKTEKYLSELWGGQVLLTSSCTAALETSAFLMDIQPGDEVIVPDFTFVSSALAFANRGATIKFVDVDPKTLNISFENVEKAINDKTKAVVLVHYAGIPCEIEKFESLKDRGIYIVEDAAHCVGAKHKGRPLAGLGHFTCFSFHETKNIACGEGGAILINDSQFFEQAEMIREKGTDRSQFFKNQVNKYEWQCLGSNYLMSELQASCLHGELQRLDQVTQRRRKLFENYQKAAEEYLWPVQKPFVPETSEVNGHIFFMLCENEEVQKSLLKEMKELGVHCTSHYRPLHLSPGGKKFGEPVGDLGISKSVADRIVRLPLYESLTDTEQNQVIDMISSFFKSFQQ